MGSRLYDCMNVGFRAQPRGGLRNVAADNKYSRIFWEELA